MNALRTTGSRRRVANRAAPMTVDAFNTFCATLPHAHYVMQWGGAHVWKIAGKVFAIGGRNGKSLSVSFKCSDLAFEVLKDLPGLRPAPYLASRGFKWIQRTGPESFDDETLRDHVRESYRLIARALPKKTRASLGIDGDEKPSTKSQRRKRTPRKDKP